MGRKDKRYEKNLHQQAYEKLNDMSAVGQSKAAAKQDGSAKDSIFSYSTLRTYWRHIRYFIRWIHLHHPECTTLKKARKYAAEWLASREAQGLSAWTLHTENAAICKLFGIAPDDPHRYQPPRRRREDIKRSRVDVASDKHFSVTNNDELIKFVRATGTRRNVLVRLKGDDLWDRERMEQQVSALEVKPVLTETEHRLLSTLKDALTVFPEHAYFLHHRKDKGGRYRFAPIIGPHINQVVERMKNTAANEPVWQHVHKGADIHSYRADYATTMYKMHARKIDNIPFDRINKGSGKKYQSDVYVCRNDECGKKLDKAAMYKASKALGHNRLDVVANNYIRGI